MPGKGLGGKRRTLTAQCGKVIQGNPERLSVLVRLHTKCCASCQQDRAMANSVGEKFQRDNVVPFDAHYTAQRPAVVRIGEKGKTVMTMEAPSVLGGGQFADGNSFQDILNSATEVVEKKKKAKKKAKKKKRY